MAKSIEEYQIELKKYTEDGVAKLYYALNRKAWEMADMLNDKNLKDVNLDDPKDKTFDRLKVIWNDAASISGAVKALGESFGATGDEDKDIKKGSRITTPESIADHIGELAGQNKK